MGCFYCDKGFPKKRQNGAIVHYGSQRLGMIADAPCTCTHVNLSGGPCWQCQKECHDERVKAAGAEAVPHGS